MTGGLWALLMLALVLLAFWYFLRTPRKLQTLGDPNNRAVLRMEEDKYEAVPVVDEAETPGGPYDRATQSVRPIMEKEKFPPPER